MTGYFQIQSLHDIIRQYASSAITGCYHTKQLDLMIHSPVCLCGKQKPLCVTAVLCEGHLFGGVLLSD